jgi:hypothetical protein
MVGGGVEATGRRDQFSGHFHTHQHFASGFAIVAGGLEDVRDGSGDIVVLQEAQDGLPVGRADGTGTQACELVMVTFARPVDGGDAGFRGMNVVGQRDRLGAEGMFGRQQELVAVAGGVGSEQQARASGLEQG